MERQFLSFSLAVGIKCKGFIPKQNMSETNKSCPKYPAKGFIISGDPTTTVSVTGCSQLSVTGTPISGVVAPGLTNRQTTSAPKQIAAKPVGGRSSSLVPGSSRPDTSKAHKVQMRTKLVESHASGTGKVVLTKSTTKPVSLVPTLIQGNQSKNDSKIPEVSPSASTAPSNNTTRHKNPSKRAFVTRRSAYKIISRFGEKPADELTERERNSLQWAKTLIAELKSNPPATEDGRPKRSSTHVAPKRQRSEEDTPPGTKRPKNMPPRPQTKSYKEVAKDHLIWAIIDRNASDGTISSRNWRLAVTPALSGVFMNIVRNNPGPPPQCEDVGWYQGHIKLISCADERSALLYKKAIETLGEVWPGAKLEAIHLADVPQRPRSFARFPAIPSDPKEILEILQVSNPQLPTHDWRVAKVSEPVEGTRKATVILNSESLPLLRETQGKVFYGFGTIFLKVYKGDDKEKPQALERSTKESYDAESALSSGTEDTQSVSGLVGDFFEGIIETENEDVLLESDDDPEDGDITVVNNDQL